MKKLKYGIMLMFLGVGIPITLFFYQDNGELFKLNIVKHDKLREAEVDMLNFIEEASKDFISFYEMQDKVIFPKGTVFPTEMLFGVESQYPSRSRFEMIRETLWNLAYDPPAPNIEAITKTDGLKYPKFKTIIFVEHNVGIPYRYSIGLGTFLFLIGLFIIVLRLIDKKGIEGYRKKPEKN